jgi:hypothetical protein
MRRWTPQPSQADRRNRQDRFDEPAVANQMVDRMIMEGLVHHQAGMFDPRQVNLMLTELGRKSTAWARTMTRQYPTCWQKEK